jgi:hypothetical protein
MTPTRTAFMVLAGLLALLGLFTAAAARDAGLAVFGWGLLGFGVLFCLSLVKRSFDEAEDGPAPRG